MARIVTASVLISINQFVVRYKINSTVKNCIFAKIVQKKVTEVVPASSNFLMISMVGSETFFVKKVSSPSTSVTYWCGKEYFLNLYSQPKYQQYFMLLKVQICLHFSQVAHLQAFPSLIPHPTKESFKIE